MTIFHKNENFRRINDKINRDLEKTYTNNHAKFQSDRCKLFQVIAKTKIDNLHTHTHTHIHTFSADDFFFNVDHIYTKKVEISQLIFDPNSNLYSIKD